MLTKLRERPRGSVLLLVLFLLIVLAMMGSAFSILLPVEMQNAKRDRANIQTAYAADAAVLWTMEQLDVNDDLREDDGWKDLEGETQVLSKEWEWRIASVDRLDGEEAYKVVTEGIRIRGSQKDVLRRAVAIIDNSWVGEQSAVTNVLRPGENFDMGSGWPGNVPIYGDAIVLGNWVVDDSKIDYNNGPTFTGTIIQSDDSGSGLRGETYTGTNLTPEQYDQVYTNGTQGVQTGDANDLEDLYMSPADARRNTLKYLFSTDDETTLDTMNSTTAGTNGIHIPLNQDGVPNGGVVVNDGDQNKDMWRIEFSVDGDGNSVMSYDGNSVGNENTNSIASINTIEASSPSTLTNVSTPSSTTRFKVIHVTSGSTYGPEGEQRLVILDTNNSNAVIYNQPADFSGGIVVMNRGNIGVKGTFAGEKTVTAASQITIEGELLKDGIERGRSTSEMLADETVSDDVKERLNNNLLGLVSSADAGNQSHAFSFDIQSQPVVNDNNVYIHASMMGSSSDSTGNAKLFGVNSDTDLLSSLKLTFYGQLATGDTNSGQYNHQMDFIGDHVGAIYSDDVPIGFPTNIEGFTPRLRAYVDQQSFDTE